MDAVLQTLRAELVAIDGRRALLTTAIASLEQLCGVTVPPSAPAKPDVTPRDPIGVARVGRLVDAERKASSGIKGDELRVVELLTGRGELSPRAIASVLEMAPESCRWVLKKLRGKGLIETHGSTNNAVVRLKMAKAKPAPVVSAAPIVTPQVASTDDGLELEVAWNGSTKRAPADVLQERREAQR